VTDTRSGLIFAAVVALGVLLYLLAPVLTPFLVAALLAYIGDPLVDRLEAHRLSRTWSVLVVFVGLSFVSLILLAIIVPLLGKQLQVFVSNVPVYIDWLQNVAMPWIQQRLNLSETPDIGELKQVAQENWKQVGGVVAQMIKAITGSGAALLAVVANMILIPVVTFYLLRDWDTLVKRVHDLLPANIEPLVSKLAIDTDEVLGAFMRGQLLVMLSLSLFYSLGLWAAGLHYALLIGLIAGILSFVPYLGVVIGIGLAVVAGLFQFDSVSALWPIAVVFGIGQLLESFLLTPFLVGDRIGLHPVTVIFAIAAFGQLFGFFGILLALPAAAVVMVIVRHAHKEYRNSDLYGRQTVSDTDCGDGC